MKKTFSFIVSNKKPERQADSIKYEIKRYIGRERRKKLPEGVDYWDFDCKIGDQPKDCEVIRVSDINKNISRIFDEKKQSFYVEILAKPGYRKPKEKPDGSSGDK